MPQYEDVYEPPMLDSTGQAILQAIQALSAPSATNVAVDATGMDIITAENAQGALKQLDTAVDSVNASLTNNFRFEQLSNNASVSLTFGTNRCGIIGIVRKATSVMALYFVDSWSALTLIAGSATGFSISASDNIVTISNSSGYSVNIIWITN